MSRATHRFAVAITIPFRKVEMMVLVCVSSRCVCVVYSHRFSAGNVVFGKG